MKGDPNPFSENNRFSLLAEMSDKAVLELDSVGVIVSANPGFHHLAGCLKDPAGIKIQEFFSPTDPRVDLTDRGQKRGRLHHTEGDFIECEYTIRDYHEGTVSGFVMVLHSVRPILLRSTGETVLESIFIGGSGLTDEIFVEKALGHTEEATGSGLALYYAVDPLSGRIAKTFVSPSTRHFLIEKGFRIDQSQGAKFNGFLEKCLRRQLPTLWTRGEPDPPTLPEGFWSVDRILALPVIEGTGPVGIIVLINRPWPYRDAEISFLAFYGKLLNRLLSRRRLLADLTEKSRLLEKAIGDKEGVQRKAESPDRSRSLFLANLSHHIRNPMNGIMGFAELLNEDTLTAEERRSYIGVIHENGRMLLDLLDSLLDLSRVEAGLVVPARASLLVSQIMYQVAARYREGFQGNKLLLIQLANELPADLDRVTLDGDLLRKALVSVINHVLYTAGSESLELCCRTGGPGLLRFEIIWHPDETDTDFPGDSENSVEMTLAAGLVRLLSGTIKKEIQKSRGTIITLEIPCQRQEKGSSGEGLDSEGSKGIWRNRRILIIEDDDISFQFLNAALRTTGVIVFRADNGVRGIRFVEENKDIDLVLLDIRLPEMDGIEAAGKIKAIRKDLVLIAQTAYTFPEDRERCLEAGCVDVLIKPIRREQLFNILRKWL